MPLSSTLFTANLSPAVAARLEQVLAGRQPIKLNERSEAVRLLQTALIALGHPIPDGPTDFFGGQTDAAVRSFQGRHAQKHGAPDGIVGPLTLGLIDLGLMANLPKVDSIFVYNFEGNPNQGPILDDDVLPLDSLQTAALKPFIVRKGLRTTDFNSSTVTAFLDLEAGVCKATIPLVNKLRIYIIGSSAGGRVALKFAEKLTAGSIPIRYVGVTDAALFEGDRVARPRGPLDDLPTFGAGNIVANIKKNYFQTHGNHVTVGIRSGGFHWKSSMNGEVHGEVLGFSNPDRNLDRLTESRLLLPPALTSDLDLHITCNKIAIRRMREHVITDLDGGKI